MVSDAEPPVIKAVTAGRPLGDARVARVAKIDFICETELELDPNKNDKALPSDHVVVVADREFSRASGTYRIETLCTNGVRVYLDGKLVIDDWKRQHAKQHVFDIELTTVAKRRGTAMSP